MTPKVGTAVAWNTISANMMVELSPNTSKSRSAISDPEIDHLEHDEIADAHPGAGDRERGLGDVLVPDAGVEIGRHHLDDEKHGDRQRGQDQRGGAAFRRQRTDLAPHLEALTNDAGEVLQDFAEIAASRALDGDGGDKQRQVLLADAEVEVTQRGLEIGAIGDLVD